MSEVKTIICDICKRELLCFGICFWKRKVGELHRCNLAGESVDIYAILYQYKDIRDLGDDEIEKIYEEFANGLYAATDK